MKGFPPIETLVPQAGPMCLLARVLEHSRDHTVCAVLPRRSELFCDADGSVPAWVGLEYMSQCMAAHAGLEAAAFHDAPRPALLIGSRRMRLAVDRFAPDRELAVEARHHRGEAGLVSFDCAIRELDATDPGAGELLVEGRINVYTLDEGWPP